jgi:asparagine synthase (glutamine-hydrolysing)
MYDDMSGIVAIYNKSGMDSKLLERMFNSIKHEKALITHRHVGNNIALALVCKKGANMLAFNEGRSICVLFDGHIFDCEKDKATLEKKGYKFKEGGKAEFCLRCYEEFGEDFVKRLNGQFIIAIADMKKCRLLILSDRMGSKPFYYFKGGGKFLFASEIKSILQDESIKREVDDDAVANFFAFDKVLGEKTLMKNIHILPPASILEIVAGDFKLRKYWALKFEEDHENSLDYYIENLIDSIRNAIGRRFLKNSLFTLSGGLDTRLLVSVAQKINRPLHTFTIGDDTHDEVKIAKKIAGKINASHSVITIKEDKLPKLIERWVYITDGICNFKHFGFSFGIDEMKVEDTIIGGAGLGELLGDYLLDESCLDLKNDKGLVNYCYNKLNTLFSESDMPLLFSKQYYKKIKGKTIKYVEREIVKSRKYAKLPANIIFNFLFRTHLRHVLFYGQFANFKLDIVLPSTDIDFINFALKIPPEIRIDRNLEFETLNIKFPRISGVIYNQTGVPVSFHQNFYKMGKGVQSQKVLKKVLKKMVERGENVIVPDEIEYIDFKCKFRRNKKLVRFLKSILFDNRFLSRPYFNQGYVKKLFVEFLRGKNENFTKLCSLATFELWHRFFIDE